MVRSLIALSLLCFSHLFFSTIVTAGVITAQLTGDGRLTNPDNLVVDVEITYDGAVSQWKIQIDSPAHPDIKLDQFYFNLNIDSNLIEFADFDPTGWTVSSPRSVAGGGAGSSTFDFVSSKGSPPGKIDNVTNDQSLSFTATLLEGNFWNDDIFLLAPSFNSNDRLLGSGQLGAHLQSLGDDGEDSGFALGAYGSFTPGPPLNEVPEPSSLLVWAAVACISGHLLRRRRSARIE